MSPVCGLTDARRLPRLGKIHLGIKMKGKKGDREYEYPKAVDYFVCPPEIQAVYGEKPLSLPVLLPGNHIEDNFPIWLKQYGRTRGLVCKGNGETATRVETETGEIKEIDCPYKACEFYLKNECKEIGVLSFLLPEVEGIGVWQVATSSVNSILNLQSEMALIKGTCGGRLAGIPLDLTLEPQEVQPKGESKKTVWVLHLRSGLRLAEIRALPPFESIGPLALPPVDEFPEDLYPDLMGSPEGNGAATNGKGPMNSNGGDDSEYPEQRDFWIRASGRSLISTGARLLLLQMFGVEHTRELSKEECLAAIGAVDQLSEADIGAYNRGEVPPGVERAATEPEPTEVPEATEPPEMTGEELLAAINEKFVRLAWLRSKQIKFVFDVTGKGSLDECGEADLTTVLNKLLDGEEA